MGGWLQGDSNASHLSCTLLVLHQLHLRSSGIRPRRLGTHVLEWKKPYWWCSMGLTKRGMRKGSGALEMFTAWSGRWLHGYIDICKHSLNYILMIFALHCTLIKLLSFGGNPWAYWSLPGDRTEKLWGRERGPCLYPNPLQTVDSQKKPGTRITKSSFALCVIPRTSDNHRVPVGKERVSKSQF